MKKWIFLSLTVGICYSIKAQGIDTSYLKKISFKKTDFGGVIKPVVQKILNAEKLHTTSLQPSIINAFDPNALPFFCKIEYKMGLQAKIPIKIRLGDPDKVDEMEKKGVYKE